MSAYSLFQYENRKKRPYTISVPFEKNDEFIKNSVPFLKYSVPFVKDSVPFLKDSVPFINNSVPKILYRTRCQIFNKIKIKRKVVNIFCWFDQICLLEILTVRQARSKLDGLGSKWTVQGSETGRPKRLKVGGLGPKWTVCESGRSRKEKNWTV